MSNDHYWHRCSWCQMHITGKAEKVILNGQAFYFHANEYGYCLKYWLEAQERQALHHS